jgi:hypothetical protein
MYLFADTFVRTPTRFSIGIEVPCRAAKVEAVSLAAVLCATALWRLWEHGFVALDAVERKHLFFFRSTTLSVRKVKSDERVGVEGMIMDYLPRPIGQMSLTYQWRDVMRAALNEVTALGCMKKPDAQGGEDPTFFVGAWLVPDCTRIATFTDAYNKVATEWTYFQASERLLYQALMEECWKGVQPYDPTWRPERY